jgi:succinate dehydrogenase / fumarate reductase, membrane anchor subunit
MSGTSSSQRLRSPLKRVKGLGSAGSGTGHWWRQRLTAIALVPLTLWFVWIVLGLIGQDAFVVRARLAEPVTGMLLAAYVIALFWHAQLGVQVVIEDYVHTRWLEITLQVLVKFAALAGALLAVLSIIRIALGN